MKHFIEKIKNKENLSFEESKAAFKLLMEGKVNEQDIFDFLTFLSAKGEASDEIAGGVYILREKSKRVNVDNCIDTCGTGGDGMNTLNISTASALLLASMGIKVAKHGNKAVSSKCGSGDVLEKLNININFEPKDIETQINENNFDKESFNEKIIKKKNHELWLRKFIKDQNIMYGIFNKKKFIGYIRIEKNKKNLVSWAITKKFWGKINFFQILKKKTKKNFIAKIKLDNKASQIVALKAGFTLVGNRKNFLLFKK